MVVSRPIRATKTTVGYDPIKGFAIGYQGKMMKVLIHLGILHNRSLE